MIAGGRSIYIDFTDVLEYARHHETVAGITRATLVIAGHLVGKHGRGVARLLAWHPTRKAAFELESDWCRADYEFDRAEFCTWFDLDRSAVRTTAHWALDNYASRPVARRYHTARALLMAAVDNKRFFRKRQIYLPRMIGAKLKPVRSKPGDIIITLGATWNMPAYMAFLRRQKQAGIDIHLFIHDLVPILMPEHVIDGVPEHFTQWLAEMCGLASGFVTNSQSTRRDLAAQLATWGVDRPIDAVPLAQHFLTSSAATAKARRLRARVLSEARLPFVLCVGTIESRKNVWGLARVWARLADELGFKTPRLVFAGKHGWLKEDFDDLMHGTGHLGGLVRIVVGPTEHELAYLYSRCLFTVFPSFYEGWGLPVGESLWFGKACVTSDRGGMPEVGMDMCAYANPADLDELHAVIKRVIVDLPYRAELERRIVRSRLRTWNHVADEIWSVLSARGRSAVDAGTTAGP